jgi:hypothetical protein
VDFGPFSFAASGVGTLDANSVDSDNYVDGSIDAEHLATGAVGTNALAGVDLGCLSVAASGVGSLAGNIAEARLTNALWNIFGNVGVVATSVSTTQATITCTCSNLFGATLASAKTFTFWFTTDTQQTTPSLQGLESWTYVAHGEVNAYFDLNTAGNGSDTNMIYVGTTHTDGTMDFLVTSATVGWTNYFHVLGPNGSHSKTAVKYVAP